ncbi:glycosyltransferase family 2 protein [Pseudomonas sp. HN2]|jgi:glycosyltransferase involved in cell wall biosynthesis|uniref:Glycosyl transferase n=1 Tax=Pseudomonas fluorescens TaxID=294 RepID=A0AAE2DXG9_PSEFL|nr:MULTISPECIES: glycosyltransferase family 2 protein [Pseudomonas]KIP94857.1 glycosyl transferase [Pseudomonas fluorescens]KPG86019.1 glycosyl transferase [Pseudomonas sp. RIT-PI-o]PWB36621.1 glycosyltransferase [Pseudomonas sp. NDM]UEB94410.1 glycosyltransferase family 2 protein [Pseudomonas sp. HN2]UST57418.1 glycosyltransferase family 2 protein [Pseudomonas moraviensis]
MRYSVIVPVYKNADSIPRLIQALTDMNTTLENQLEVVFVVDGSPDDSFLLLKQALGAMSFSAQLLAHSRNFGSFPAIRTGLMAAKGDYFGVMAADLQEPPELLINFFRSLANDECDVAIGTRNARQDPFSSRMASSIFWGLYRRLVVHDMPPGGVDIFGCNKAFREQLLQLNESRSSLIALIFWLGFRRKFIEYERQTRLEGKSAWTFKKKLEYMMDSVFAFTDYPIRLLTRMGAMGSLISLFIGFMVIIAKLSGAIEVPGYAATMLVVLLLGTLNLLGLGLVGTYAWRAYENSKQRPLAIVCMKLDNKEHSND